MRTVYLLSEGSYSDYHVIGVFADRADAERFSDRYDATAKYADLNDIEEFTVYEAGEQPGHRTYHEFTAEIAGDGTVRSESETEYAVWDIGDRLGAPYDDHPHVHAHRQIESETTWTIYLKVVAWDREAAAKAYRDRVAKIRAEKMEL